MERNFYGRDHCQRWAVWRNGLQYVVLGIIKPGGVGCGKSRLQGTGLYDNRIVFVVSYVLDVHQQWDF